MLRKYLPLIVLVAAGALLLYVKMHQRGPGANNTKATVTDQITVPAVVPPSDAPNRDEDGLNRHTAHIIYSKHARCRMDCRHIDESEVKEILEKGTINYSKVEDDGRGKTYPLEGVTHDKQHVRIVFAPKDDGLLVVTCIDLDTEWSCDCK